MAKRILLIASFLSVSAFAATDAEIIKHFKSTIQVPNIAVEVISRKSVDGIVGMDFVSLNLSDGTQTQKLSIFTKDDLIFPDIINIKQGGSIKDMIENAELQKKMSVVYKKEDKKNIISLGNDSKKETIIVLSDPECPYCRQELTKIEQKLLVNNVKLILTPVHARSSLEKSALIYHESSKVKTDSEKIAILKKYFDENVVLDQKVSDQDIKKIEDLKFKYFVTGIKGVPFMVLEKELLK